MSNFLDRMDHTNALDNALKPFLEEHGVTCFPFGQPVLLPSGGGGILPKLRRLLIRDYPREKYGAGFMVKFAPDYICTTGKSKQGPFLLDTKASVVPIFFNSYLEQLKEFALEAGCHDLTTGDVGEIEREAWDVYTKNFPAERVAICFGAPYHPRLVAMEWCSNIRNFFRFKKNRNLEAGGSQTPHVNIHLGMMRTPAQFLSEEFGIKVDPDAFAALQKVVQNWPIEKPAGRVNWRQFVGAIRRMRTVCPWIKGKMPDEVRQELMPMGI